MSEDIFQDRPKFTKKRGGGVGGNNGPPNDYKQPKRNHNRYYPVDESKGYDKPPRDQNGPGKGSYSPAYDEYGSKPPRNDNYQPYKGKPHNSKQRTPNVWRKKTNKISKESILETFARVKPHRDIDEWVRDYKELFVKEPQPPVNDQVFQFDPNEAIVTKTSRPPPSGGPQKETENQPSAPETGNNANKGLQMFDFAQERHDPILEMRKKKVGGDKPEKKSGQKEQGFDELLEDESSIKALGGHQKFGGLEGELGGKNDEELGGNEKDYGLDDNDEEKFSDIDARFEKKLKNHEIQEVYEDAFDDLLEPSDKKGQLEMMENSERPLWEDLDTNQVIEDIKHEDFLSTLPQDKTAIFGKDYVKREPKKQEQNHFDEQHGNRFQNNFDFDFSKVGFHDPKALDDFPLKGIDDDDLFPSTFNQGIQQKANLFGQEAGGNPSFMNQMNFSDPMMQQQGNMARLAQQNPNMMNNMPSFFQFQQMQQQMPHMPQMMQMPRNQQQMQQMNQMNPMEIMAKMGVKYPQQGNPNFVQPIKPNPQQREMPVAGFPRQQLNPTYPSFIFKYFSPSYDDKLWYYIDLQKVMQGPFSGKIMDEWYANGHLPLTLHVTIGKGNTFKTLKELADLIVNRTLGDDNYMSANQNNEGRHFEPMQQGGQAGFSGVADLLKNRPDLAQFGANQQAPVSGKAKGLDEVEKVGSFPHQREQNFPENYGRGEGGNYHYHQKGGQNGPNYGEFGGQGQYYQKNQMKKGGYPMGGQGGYDYNRDQMGVDSPNKNVEGDQNMNKMISHNPSSASSTLSGSTDFSAKNKGPNEKPQQDQTKEAQKTEGGQGEPLQNVNDMTNHLKNILGLSLGGGMLNLGGLVPAQETKNVTKPTRQEPVEGKIIYYPAPKATVEIPQQQTQQQNERFNPQAHMTLLPRQQQQTHNHHYHHHEKQDKPEKQQQQQQPQTQNQNQRKGSKAPKIDTADFPSLGEAYK